MQTPKKSGGRPGGGGTSSNTRKLAHVSPLRATSTEDTGGETPEPSSYTPISNVNTLAILNSFLSDKGPKTVESLHADLMQAALLGQQLLDEKKNLESRLQAEARANEQLKEQVAGLKSLLKSEHEQRMESSLQLLQKEEMIASMRRKLAATDDVKQEAECLRNRVEHLDGARGHLDKVLNIANKELKAVLGERHYLQLTVQELYDQLGNFMEINASLKNSCAKQVEEYKLIISELQEEKAVLSKKFAEQVSRINSASSKESLDALNKTIKEIFEADQATVLSHTQQQTTADMLALHAALDNVESEKRELLDLISRQQDTIKSMEDDAMAMDAKFSDKSRTPTRDFTAMKDFKSLRSSLSNADLGAAAADSRRMNPSLLSNELNSSSDILSFIEHGQRHSAQIESELVKAESDIEELSKRINSFSHANTSSSSNRAGYPIASNEWSTISFAQQDISSLSASHYVSIETVEALNSTGSRTHRSNKHEPNFSEDRGATTTAAAAATTAISGMDASFLLKVAQEENNYLRNELKEKRVLIDQNEIEIENLKRLVDQAAEEFKQMKGLSLSNLVNSLEQEVKKNLTVQSELTKSLVKTREELLQATANITAKEVELTKEREELNRISARLANAKSPASDELGRAIKENSKLIQGNLDLGSQLSKLTTEFAQNLWELRDMTLSRDHLQAQVTDMEINIRRLKKGELLSGKTSLTHRDWATQTLEDSFLSTGATNQDDKMRAMELEMKAQGKLIELLKADLGDARQLQHESSFDSQTLRLQLSDMRKERDDFRSSVDGFLSNETDLLIDSTPSIYKVTLFEARKKNSELIEKLHASEKNVEGQKATIFTIGSQLAQQSLKLGEIEWMLKQKEDERRSASVKVQKLESEKESILAQLNDATRQLEVISKRSDHTSAEDAAATTERIDNLTAHKSETIQKLEAAQKTMHGASQEIDNVNKISTQTGSDISESVLQLEIKSRVDETNAKQMNALLDQLRDKNLEFDALKANADSFTENQKCARCEANTEQITLLMNKLEKEVSKTKASIDSRAKTEQQNAALTFQLIDLQKKLDATVAEAETAKQQIETKLKSYEEMKKLITLNQRKPAAAVEDDQTPRIILPGEDSNEDLRIVFHSGSPTLAESKKSNAEVFKSSDLLANHLAQTNSVQMQLDAAKRENEALQQRIKSLELHVAESEERIRFLNADSFKHDAFMATQLQDRNNLAAKIGQLQREISEHISAKGELEAELLSKSQEKKSIFKRGSLSPTRGFSRSRNGSSTSKDGSGIALSPTGEKSLEARIVDERDKLAKELSYKSAEVSKLTKDVSDLSIELSKTRLEARAVAEKSTAVAREHADELKCIMMAHSEVEECLQNQIQELTDQLMEPKSLATGTAGDMKQADAFLSNALKMEQVKVKHMEISLKEASIQLTDSQLKLETLESELNILQSKHQMEQHINAQIIDYAQKMLDSSETMQNKMRGVQEKSASAGTAAEMNALREQVLHLQNQLQQQIPQESPSSAKQRSSRSRKMVLRKTAASSVSSVEYSDTEEPSDLEVIKLRQKVEIIENLLNTSATTADQNERDKQSLIKDNEIIKAELENSLQQSTQLETKLKSVSLLLQNKSTECGQLMEEKTQLSNRMDTLVWKLQCAQEKCAEAESKVAILEAKEKRAAPNKTSLSGASVSSLSKDACQGCEQLGNTMKQLIAEVADWQSRGEKASIDITNMEWQKCALEAKLTTAETELTFVRKSKEDLDSALTELKGKMADIKSKHAQELETVKLTAEGKSAALGTEIKQAEETVQAAVQQYNHLQSENEKEIIELQQELSRWETNAADKDAEFLSLKQKCAELEAALLSSQSQSQPKTQHMESSLEEYNSHSEEELKSVLQSYNDKLEELENSNAELAQQLQNLEAEKSTVQSELSAAQSEMQALKEKMIENVRSSVIRCANLKRNVTDLEALVQELEEKNEQLEAGMTSLRDRGDPGSRSLEDTYMDAPLADQEQERRQSGSQNAANEMDWEALVMELKTTNEQLQLDLNAASVQMSDEGKVDELQQRIIDLQERNDGLQAELDQLSAQSSQLKQDALSSANALQLALDEANTKCQEQAILYNTAQFNLEEKDQQIESLTARLEEDVDSWKTVLNLLETRIAELELELANEKTALAGFTKAEQERITELESANSRIVQVKELRISELESLSSRIMQEKEAQISDLDLLSQIVKEKESRISELESLSSQMMLEKDSKISQLESFSSEMAKTKDSQISELETALATTRTERDVLKAETMNQSQLLTKSKSRVEELVKLSIVRSTNLQAKEARISDMEVELARLQSELDKSIQSCDSLAEIQHQTQFSAEVKLKQELKAAKSRIDELIKLSVVRTTNLKGKEDRIHELEEEIAGLQSELHQVKSGMELQLLNAEVKFEQSSAAAKAKIEESTKAFRALSNVVAEKEQQAADLESQISDLLSQVRELKLRDEQNADTSLRRRLHIDTNLDDDIRMSTMVAPSSSAVTESPVTAVNEHPVEKVSELQEISLNIPKGMKLVENAIHDYLFRIYWQYLALVFIM
ncbi:hypothetical protein CcCBS67573_g03042 [Chytriomyces confervae]|uniref:Uncharacterized protein n=1 Tax=Chytriomyces confervae TaxID=246404 RepID=A0A507FK29_9FUNG|nr:hypothetical protein CcCBS67573_g03042 [Chytriomyces confervae]